MRRLFRKWPGCRRALALWVGLWGLSAGGAGAAPVWVLAPGLEVAPLENFQLRWQSLKRWGVERALVGLAGSEPGYFIAARRAADRRERQHWAALEKHLRQLSDARVKRLFSGRTSVELGRSSYRAYRYRRAGEPVAQLYHLLQLDDRAYWLYATAVAPLSLDKLLPVTQALVRRAHKKAGQ